MTQAKWLAAKRMTLQEWLKLSEEWERETTRIKNLGIDLSKVLIVSEETYRGKDNNYGTV